MKNLLFISAAILLSGCATVGDIGAKMSGMGRIEQRQDTFDNSVIITLSPAPLYDEQSWLGVPVLLGARWTSNAPEYIALVLSYHSNTNGSGSRLYTTFSGLSVNIDGTITHYSTGRPTILEDSGYNNLTKTIYTESRNSVILPIRVFDKMLTADDVKVRIQMSQGYVNAHFSVEQIPGGMHTARYFMKQFMRKVCQTDAVNEYLTTCRIKN